MKKLIIVVILAGAGFFVYKNFISKGTAGTQSQAVSPQEQDVARLADDFRKAERRYNDASRGGAVGIGAVTAAEAEAAINDVNRIDAALLALRVTLTSDAAVKQANELQEKIKTFKANAK